ncbi:MAG TPA: tyrosine-protein phosphatase [Tepidiformaceae bacterium]|nr:tyrosine-protein phosphatase [Tepidiformaceae bacterium]
MELTITNRELRLEIAHNVRHLGGYTTTEGRTTRDDIIRAASLHRLTDTGMRHLAEAGVTTIIDFRSDVELERDVTPDSAPYGIRRLHAPVFQHDASPVGLDSEDFSGYGVVYERFLDVGRNAYATLFETIAEADGRILFHCAAGKDRTGVAAALLLDLAGVDEPTIIEDYTLTESLLAPMLAEWLPRMAERGVSPEKARALMAAPAEAIVSALAFLRNRYGNAEGYAREIGVSDGVISAVRSRMVV